MQPTYFNLMTQNNFKLIIVFKRSIGSEIWVSIANYA